MHACITTVLKTDAGFHLTTECGRGGGEGVQQVVSEYVNCRKGSEYTHVLYLKQNYVEGKDIHPTSPKPPPRMQP